MTHAFVFDYGDTLIRHDAFLDDLASRGAFMGILSNTSFSEETLRRVLRRFDLEKYFRFVIASSEYLFKKPDRRIFELAVKKCGTDQIHFFCDKYAFDVAGAQNAGLRAVWYNPRRETADGPSPHLELRSWAEAAELYRDSA